MLTQIYVNVPWSHIAAEFRLILHMLQKLVFFPPLLFITGTS